MQAESDSFFSQQWRTDLHSYGILFLVRIGCYRYRYIFNSEPALQFAGPHIELLIYVLDIFNGGNTAVLFSYLQSDIAQLQTMWILAEVIYRLAATLRFLYLYAIGYLLSFQFIFPERFFTTIFFCVWKAVPAPLALCSQWNAFLIISRKTLQSGYIGSKSKLPITNGQ